MTEPLKIFTQPVIDQLAREISLNNNNELFAVGKLNGNGIIDQIDILAWGNKQMTPAILKVVEPGMILIHNHPSGDLTPSDNDLIISSRGAEISCGSLIINNLVTDVKVIVKPFVIKKIKTVTKKEIKKTLHERVSSVLPNFEPRNEQIKMMNEVADSLNKGNISIIEAATGTGKTMAYLIPAIHFALKNQKRIIVSTNTINLQEQLAYKDLKNLKQALEDMPFSYVLMKGRNNYLCMRKANALKEVQLSIIPDELQNQTEIIQKWTRTTETGDISDLSFKPADELWEEFQCESDTCIRAKCSHFDECFYFSARAQCSKAQIIIVNHHLLFSDLALRKVTGNYTSAAILPAYDHLIIDEAHHCEAIASEHFGDYISAWSLRRIVTRITGTDRKPGLVHQLKSLFSIKTDNVLHISDLSTFCSAITVCVRNIHQAFFLLQKNQYIIDEEFLKSSAYVESIAPLFGELSHKLSKLAISIGRVLTIFFDSEEEIKGKYLNMRLELISVQKKAKAGFESISKCFGPPETNSLYWIDTFKSSKIPKFVIQSAPLETGPELKEALFEKMRTLILCSATLSTDNNFNFFKDRIGLNKDFTERLTEGIHHSPFDYSKRSIMGICKFISDPEKRDYDSECSNFLSYAIPELNVGTLGLFTSYQSLNNTYSNIKDELLKNDILPLRQGEQNRNQLLDIFRADSTSVLFGTDSFWEGIDVPGISLQCVIIHKLPFLVPTHPLIQARRKLLESNGKDSFSDYILPVAIIKFKQGIGRLLRHRNDYGAVFVLDKRILTKSYGKKFLKSIEKFNIISIDSKTNVKVVKDFLNKFKE